MSTDEYLQAAARVRTLTSREMDTLCRDRELEQDEKIRAVNACLDRCRADLESIAAAATSPDADNERRMTLELAAFGMPAEEMAKFVSIDDNPEMAINRMTKALRTGDTGTAVAIAADAWLRCLDGRRAWVQVLVSHPELPAHKALLESLSDRDRAAEILSFLPAFPAELTAQLATA